jgi:integration host factor subunit beta
VKTVTKKELVHRIADQVRKETEQLVKEAFFPGEKRSLHELVSRLTPLATIARKRKESVSLTPEEKRSERIRLAYDRMRRAIPTKVMVKNIIQDFLNAIISELAAGNRLEFREFGVFETRERAARLAQNPRTLEKVPVPAKRIVKFKVGRLMRQLVSGEGGPTVSAPDVMKDLESLLDQVINDDDPPLAENSTEA